MATSVSFVHPILICIELCLLIVITFFPTSCLCITLFFQVITIHLANINCRILFFFLSDKLRTAVFRFPMLNAFDVDPLQGAVGGQDVAVVHEPKLGRGRVLSDQADGLQGDRDVVHLERQEQKVY